MSNAIVPFNEMQQMGEAIAASGLFGVKSATQAVALMLVAQAEGLHPATAAQDYDIIQGRATRKTNSVLARFQAAGGKVEWHQLDNKVADATFTHPSAGSVRIDWTFEMAKAAGLVGKDNWQKFPRAMLRARCIAEGVRCTYPAAIGGYLVAEEAQDLGAASDAGDAGPAAAPLMPQRRSAQAPAPAQAADVVDVPFTETVESPAPVAPVAAKPATTTAGVGHISAGQVKWIENKAAALELSAETVQGMLQRHGIAALDTTITVEQFDKIKAELLANA